MNDFAKHLAAFDGVKPFVGRAPTGFTVDCMGVLTDINFHPPWEAAPAAGGDVDVYTGFPTPADGEIFCEMVGWFEAAREAREHYTMVTLGALYGTQAVGALLALKKINPLPTRLVAVEPDPGNFAWLKKHFRDNGLDPDHHWLLNCAVSNNNAPVLFPIGGTGTGGGNCMSTNPAELRAAFAEALVQSGDLPAVVTRLIVDGDTGIETPVDPEHDFKAVLKFVSAVTLADVLGPLERVDLLDSDMQQSESIVFPAAMDLIADKVRRVHIGTHGEEVHAALLQQFIEHGFEIVFNLTPTTEYATDWGAFRTQDGVITALNRELSAAA